MKFILAGTAFALMASVAHAQQTALDLALAQSPVPCGGSANIANASFDTNDAGQRIVRVTCQSGGLFGNAPAGAPATNIGFLAPVIGIGLAGAALGLGGGGGGGSSTPDTQ